MPTPITVPWSSVGESSDLRVPKRYQAPAAVPKATRITTTRPRSEARSSLE